MTPAFVQRMRAASTIGCFCPVPATRACADGIHPLAPDYNPAEDKVQMAATLMFQASRWSG